RSVQSVLNGTERLELGSRIGVVASRCHIETTPRPRARLRICGSTRAAVRSGSAAYLGSAVFRRSGVSRLRSGAQGGQRDSKNGNQLAGELKRSQSNPDLHDLSSSCCANRESSTHCSLSPQQRNPDVTQDLYHNNLGEYQPSFPATYIISQFCFA